MASLTYSKQASDRLKKFHRTDYIVWVEGEEDTIFWGGIFDKCDVEKYSIKEAGGKKALKKYIDSIINQNADIIVACDKDYDELLDKIQYSNKIIYTYGHSIENTMYCPKTISDQIQKYSKKRLNFENKVIEWYENLGEVCKSLLAYEIANEKFNRSKRIMGDTSECFVEDKGYKIKLSVDKINQRINEIKDQFTDEEINECLHILEKGSSYPVRFFIRGHFLTNLVINLIKAHCKQNNASVSTINTGNLFAGTVDGCLKCNKSCSDNKYLKDQILKAFNVESDSHVAI